MLQCVSGSNDGDSQAEYTVHSGLSLAAWESEMAEDPDKEFLLDGLRNGFHITEPSAVIDQYEVRNHKSSRDPEAQANLEGFIKAEIHKGNYRVVSSKPPVISAIGAVPKPDGGHRLIHDLSLSPNQSVNSFAPETDKCSYESVDAAVALLKPGFFMAKVDIKSAYRHIPIHPNSQRVTGFRWTFEDGTTRFLYDAKLPFGARAAPSIFHRISQAVKRMVQRRHGNCIVAYQDDFLIIAKSHEDCLNAWITLITLLLRLGFEVNHQKLVAPTTSLVFLGIQLDTVRCEMSLPTEKLSNIRTALSEFSQRGRVTKRQLQSLAGKLNFAAKVVRGGRTFMRRILNSISRLQRPHHRTRLSNAAKQDILWWRNFMYGFNGVSTFSDDTDIASIMSDACGAGGGAFCQGDFIYFNWESDLPNLSELPINYKEAAAAAIGVIKWAEAFPGYTIYVYIDNQCAVSIINKCSCRDETVMRLLRDMFWCVAKANATVKAVYMPGSNQVIADAISRLHEPRGLFRVESILDDWWLGHNNVVNGFQYYSLLNHMSMEALQSIFNQVTDWQRLRLRWIGTLRDIDSQHTQSLPRAFIGPN